MVVKVLRTPEDKIVKIDTSKDAELYRAPRNPPNTGTKFTRGTDLRMHTSRSGRKYFYKVFWSMWQSEDEKYWLVTEEEAFTFLIAKAGAGYWDGISEHEMEEIEATVGEKIFMETA